MDLIDKAHILSDYWIDYRDDPEWSEFMQFNDLGLPLSQAIADGLIAELTDAGKAIINESFSMLCRQLGIDDTTDDETLDDFLNRA